MAGHSILYLGNSEYSAAFGKKLKTYACCKGLIRHPKLTLPKQPPHPVDIILFDTPNRIDDICTALDHILAASNRIPIVAITVRASEHLGIAAVQAGAQAYICSDSAGQLEINSIIEDTVNRQHLFAQLRKTDKPALAILNSVNEGGMLVDCNGRILSMSPAGRSMLGLAARQPLTSRWASTFCCTSPDGVTEIEYNDLPITKACRGEQFSEQIGAYLVPHQGDIILSTSGRGLYNHASRLIGGIINFRDVTDNVQHSAQVEKQVQFDPLTKLPNRQMFTTQLQKAMGRVQRHDRLLAVLFLNLDRFKSINDTLGHDTGDKLLQRVGSRLAKNLRVSDFCSRQDSDQFIICLEDLDEPSNAASAAQKLVLVLSDKYEVDGSEIYITPSIGIVVYPEGHESADWLIKAAESAMQRAKSRGGSRFEYYSAALNENLRQLEKLEIGLRHALIREEFLLHYQPRINVKTGKLLGLEALLRWQHPSHGLLMPAKFLPILESTGLIHSAGEWIINTSLTNLASWQTKFNMPDLSMTINISQQQLKRGRLVDTVYKAITNNAIDPGCIEVEMAEGHIVRQRSIELETLHNLRKLGVRLSLDHFGVRDVSVNSLEAGGIDSFVLDQSLIQDVTTNTNHQRAVKTAIAIARGLDIEVTAEGVETIPQLEFLKTCNCDIAQGFLISQPMHTEKVTNILRGVAAGKPLLGTVLQSS